MSTSHKPLSSDSNYLLYWWSLLLQLTSLEGCPASWSGFASKECDLWSLFWTFQHRVAANLTWLVDKRRKEWWDSYPAEHAFIGHDANCEEVHGARMVLSTHNLRGHVSWCAWRVLSVFLPPNSSNTEVSYTQVTYIANEANWIE